MKNILLLLFCLLIAFEINAQVNEKELNKLVNKYEVRDGSAGIETSFLLAKEFVKNDTLFLKTMLKKKAVFSEWVGNLQYESFTIYESEDEVDNLLYKAYYEELKKLMLTRIEKFRNDPQLAELARKMKKKLIKIKIEVVNKF